MTPVNNVCDPYWGCNETNVQWVAEKDWKISRAFTVSPALLARKSVTLRLESIPKSTKQLDEKDVRVEAM